MNRIEFISIILVFIGLQLKAQTLSEEEVTEKMNQAFAFNQSNNKTKALELFLIVGENTELQRHETERQVYVCSQTMACMCYNSLKKYKDGYLLAKKLLQGQLKDNEKKEIGYMYALNGYHYACNLIKRDEKGHAYYSRCREVISEILPYMDDVLKKYAIPTIVKSWYFEGLQCAIAQKYDEALLTYTKALEGFRNLGKISEEIKVLNEMGFVKKQLNKLDESKLLYHQAAELARINGDTSKQLDALKELWKLGRTTGDMELVRSVTLSMDSLIEVSENVETKFTYYIQKGDEGKAKEEYSLAENWYIKAKELAEQDAHNRTLSTVNKNLVYSKLRDLYIVTRQYDDAIVYGREAVSTEQSHMSPNDDRYYFPYMLMAEVYRLKGDKENCFNCIDSLFMGLNRIKEPKELSQMYMARARCYHEFNDYEKALSDYKKADEILAEKFLLPDDDRVQLLALIGGLEHKLGHYAESEHYYRLYADNVKYIFGEKSLEYINALIYFANSEGFAGHIDAGCQDYVTSVAKLKRLMKERIPYMTLTERESFWNPISSLFMMMTPYALQAQCYQTSFTKSCYDALIMAKAFLLESERSLFAVIKNKGSKEDINDYMQLTLINNRIKELERDYKQNADSILALSQKSEKLAVYLAKRCSYFDDVTEFMDIDYDVVKQVMSPNDVLLDFTDFVSESRGRRYAAYIVKKQEENPRLKDLFSERQIDSLGITRPDMFYDRDYALKIIELLWKPLKGYIPEGSTVYYVPSQLLFQISLESLPLADGSLLGSHYNFVRLSSARELVRKQNPTLSAKPQSAILYGGLQYDLQPDTMLAEANKYDLSELLVMRGDLARGDSGFHELIGAKKEVEKIASILEANKWDVTSFMGAEGTEESFLNMHGKSPQVLQLATHGFYYTPDRAKRVDYLRGYSDAMSLSGIILSGGNMAWLGKKLPDGVLGGVLTANDIARLDLSNTEMVVLSACQSGQGEATSEGLYGLQRAFKKAGVGTIVMALWSINDKVSTEFMVTFYEQLIVNGLNKRKAFEQTKSIIRDKYPDPFYWAPFIMLD